MAAYKDDDTDSSFSSDSDDDLGTTGLTQNQNRLLYMISLYSHVAKTDKDKESWIRKPALMVLIYHAIVKKVLDYDYAPASQLVEGRRKYFNISQEGKSDVDYLREEELVNGLKLSSKDFQPVTCFQISDKGLEVLPTISEDDKAAIRSCVYSGKGDEADLLHVHWDGNVYYLQSDSGVRMHSDVTDCEDVSYVSSAYVPQCLRTGGRPTLSNAHRAHECKTENNIRDELDEVITLNSVSVIVAEYIPFGANQVVQLNQNLGSTERVQGGFFTAKVDEDAAGTKLEVNPGLTSINILDYSLTNHINFEADIHFPEDPGVVQVEMFGVSMNSHGTMFYGMQVEAVLDRIKDNISLDHLSRLLVDVQIDSSKIVDSVISQYQRDLLDLIFMGDAANRNKVNLILANEITPHLTAEEYMDKGEYENELKQVLGDTRAAFDISEHDTLIFGEHGILVAGANARSHEPLLCAYLQFTSMDLFVRNFFNRVFVALDEMQDLKAIITDSDSNPNSIEMIRESLGSLSRTLILLEEILGYMKESTELVHIPPEPPEQAGRALYDRLQIHVCKSQLLHRVMDLMKNIEGSRQSLGVLQEMADHVTEAKMFKLQESVNTNTRHLCALQEHNERSAINLHIMQLVLAGILAFDIMDRVTGEWTIVNTEWAQAFVLPLIHETPGLWLAINIVMWILVGYGLVFFMRRWKHYAEGNIDLQIKMVRKLNMDALRSFLADKDIVSEDREYTSNNSVVAVRWVDERKREWGGSCPTITIHYDEKIEYMLKVYVTYNRRLASPKLVYSAEDLREKVILELRESGIIYDGDGPPTKKKEDDAPATKEK